jgi:hypothetical protein
MEQARAATLSSSSFVRTQQLGFRSERLALGQELNPVLLRQFLHP